MAFEETCLPSGPLNLEAALFVPSRRAEAAGPESGSLLIRLVSSAVPLTNEYGMPGGLNGLNESRLARG